MIADRLATAKHSEVEKMKKGTDLSFYYSVRKECIYIFRT
jgi:hypothetical protein